MVLGRDEGRVRQGERRYCGDMGYDEGQQRREQLETAVRTWRFEQFVRLGFNPAASSTLAESRVDLSQVRKLIASGCPPETASRILL
ncbi:MAG: hypothetical protein ABR583_09260 [Gaiellaceae bacterium]